MQTLSRAQTILEQYDGEPWWFHANGSGQTMTDHLVDHGFTREDLAGLSDGQLMRLHGAVHTDSRFMSPLKAVATQAPVQAVTQRKITYQQPQQVFRIFQIQDCPNGRCRLR